MVACVVFKKVLGFLLGVVFSVGLEKQDFVDSGLFGLVLDEWLFKPDFYWQFQTHL